MRISPFDLISGLFIIVLAMTACPPGGFATPQPVVMKTDKILYAQGETITLRVTNNMDIPVWYIGYPQPDLAFWIIERARDDEWQSLSVPLPQRENGTEVCRMTMYERPVGQVMGLKPHSNLLDEWNQKICLFRKEYGSTEPEMIERGRYRFVLHYSMDTVKTADAETKPWLRPVELGAIKVIHSNEFMLE